MKTFSAKLFIGLLVLFAFTSAQAPKPAKDNHADVKDKDTHHVKFDAAGKAAGAGTIKVDANMKGAANKDVAHGELQYLKPPGTKPDQCVKDRQVPKDVQSSPDVCANYHDKKWDGFMMDPKAQQAAFPDLVKFAKEYGTHFWGKDIEQIPGYSNTKYPDYVYGIGLCTSKLWSQNLVNNKLIFNAQITDYDDIQYSKCAKYDQLARSCLIGSANPDPKKNACWKYYANNAARVGKYDHIDNGRLRRRLETTQIYDDLVKEKMLDGTVKTTRKGKFFEQASSMVKDNVNNKTECMNRVLNEPVCALFRHMMPSALQREVKQTTFLHKSTVACLPCAKCKECPTCPKCAACGNCEPLSDWEVEALHKAIAVDGDSGESIKEGVTCDTEVIKPVTDAVAADVKLRAELLQTMKGPSGDLNANKEGKSNLLTAALGSVLLLALALYN